METKENAALLGNQLAINARGMTIDLVNEIAKRIRLPKGQKLKPFGGHLPEAMIFLPTDWWPFIENRFERSLLPLANGKERVLFEQIAELTLNVGRLIQECLGWNDSRANTVAIEYVVSALGLAHETDILPVSDYAKTVGEELRPAYKALNNARELTLPEAFDGDFDAKVSLEGRLVSRREINQRAVEAYWLILRLTSRAHLGMFREGIANAFPIFEDEKAWRAFRAIANPEIRRAVIACLKKEITNKGWPVFSRTDVIRAQEMVATNQAMVNGVSTGVTMFAFVNYLFHTLGDRVKEGDRQRFSLKGMSVDSFTSIFESTLGYVSDGQIELCDGEMIKIAFALRDTKEPQAMEIGVPMRLTRKASSSRVVPAAAAA